MYFLILESKAFRFIYTNLVMVVVVVVVVAMLLTSTVTCIATDGRALSLM